MTPSLQHRDVTSGFTLIEMSIVLVIIGLIVGGVLVGQDLIAAAAIRSQISQIEKYNTAVNTFRGKYGYLPGDMPDPQATQFGFIGRGTGAGMGDGDGVLRGTYSNVAAGFYSTTGEVVAFWTDLSTAGFIDGGFSTASETVNPGGISGSTIGLYLPVAKIGAGNYVNVWSGGTGVGWSGSAETGNNGINYYSVSVISALGTGGYGITASSGLTVIQAYNIDKKIDDGVPQSGKVTANYLDFNIYHWTPIWAGAAGNKYGAPYTTATNGTATTCFDNGGVAGAMQYSMEQNGGNGVNCALSFQFQ